MIFEKTHELRGERNLGVDKLRCREQINPAEDRGYLKLVKNYNSTEVSKFLKTSKIQILFLPPYSPNLNLIEGLFRFFKKMVPYNQYYEKFTEFRTAVLNFFKNIKQYKTELRSPVTLKFHLLGAWGLLFSAARLG